MKNFFVVLPAAMLLGLMPLKSGKYHVSFAGTPPAERKHAKIPDDLYPVFKNSCMGCHSDDKNIPAVVRLDFSRWEKYRYRKQVKKAGRICYMVSKESMPPENFRKKHPELVPSQQQVSGICDWARRLKNSR